MEGSYTEDDRSISNLVIDSNKITLIFYLYEEAKEEYDRKSKKLAI